MTLGNIQAESPTESQADFDQRMEWFSEAKFGLFIHWGAYSSLKGVWEGKEMDHYAEWIQATANISKEDYSPVAAQFDPIEYDADLWARTAKEAGMKYVVITTKHHEGFCLWDSAYTDYDIKDTAGVDRDLLGELQVACEKYGLKFGTYYSIIDWHHPSQQPNPDSTNYFNSWGQCSLTGAEAKAEYVTYMKLQLKELVDRYDTQIFWFDGDWNHFWTLEDGADLYAYLRELQPEAIINNRVSKRGHFKKDFGTPEQETPAESLDYNWEACWTVNQSWGFKAHDTNWKSTHDLIAKLCDITGKGGNFLLNVGPTGEGAFPEACTERLLAMGAWLADNGEAIYGTTKGPFATTQIPWGAATVSGQKLYLHVASAPENQRLELPKLYNALTAAYPLQHPEQAIALTQTDDATLVDLSAMHLAPLTTVFVIVIEFEGTLELNGSEPPSDSPATKPKNFNYSFTDND